MSIGKMEHTGLTFLGEEDFLPAMEGPCRDWRETAVRDGCFESFDGAEIHYYCASPENPAACVTVIPGFCEFYGKYHELTWYLYRAGYAFYFIENRGHGYSARMTDEWDVVHIDSMMTHAKDLHCFMEQVVIPACRGLTHILWAHSMGGAIATLYLENYPAPFRAAVLNSPMFKIKAILPPEKVRSMRQRMEEEHTEKMLIPGQKHFSPEPDFAGSSAQSRPRYDYVFSQRLGDIHYQTRGGSVNWFVASCEAYASIMEQADKVQIPLQINTAGLDHLIDADGYREFGEKAACPVEFHNYPEAGHELFTAVEEVRKAYFVQLFETLKRFCC